MKTVTALAAAVALSLTTPLAQAAWGDISYDPMPPLFDEDRAAQFDIFGLLSHSVIVNGNLTQHTQNFESGFTPGQRLDDWVALGGTRVRFGSGASLDAISWQSVIGGVDPHAPGFSLTHPHGTYGNAPGVLGQPRNYIADHHFLTFDSSTPPAYVVMQFEHPINWLSLTMIDYAAGTGGSANLSLWNGASFDARVEVPPGRPENATQIIAPGEEPGDLRYWIGSGVRASSPDSQFPSFNYAIFRLDTPDATIGFDNIIVGIAAVPEPPPAALLSGGILLFGALLRRRSRGRSLPGA